MPLIHRKRKKHRIRKTSADNKNILDYFITSYLFKISGLVVLLIGVYYAFNSFNALSEIQEMLTALFKPSQDLPITQNSDVFDPAIIFYFLPGLLGSILASLFAKRFSFIAYLISILSIIYFFIFQIKILVYNPFHNGPVYPPAFVAEIFLVLITIVLFINALLLKKPFILILTSVYVYLSVALIMTRLNLNNLLSLSLVFTLSIAWSAGKIQTTLINLINFIFTIGFFGLFWVRKLAVNSQTEYLLPFFIYSTLFYILFFSIVFYASGVKEKPMPKWMQITMGSTNFLFFVGTTAFVIIKYYSFDYLWIFALGLLLFNLLGLYLSGKYFPAVWKLPLHIITILLAALVLPLFLNQSTILLFTAGLSLLLLLYSKYSKNQPSIIISMISMGIMSLDFFFHWIFNYLPALVFSNDIPTHTLMGHGILSGMIVFATLTISIPLLKDLDVTLSKNVFSKIRYSRLIKGLTLFSLFLTLGWIFSALVFVLSGSSQLVSPMWFISGCLFFILLITFNPQQFKSFLKPALFLSWIFTLSYSILVHLNFLESLNDLMLSGNMSNGAIIIHFTALGLLMGLTAISLVRLYALYPMNKTLRRGLQLYGLLIIILILFTEYDNLSILFRTNQFALKPSLGMGQEILAFNHRLPFSLILIASSMGVLVWSLFKRHRFLRNTSILLFISGIIKIFLYDFTILNEVTRTILFFFIGLLLLSFSFFYPKLKKAANNPRNHHGR